MIRSGQLSDLDQLVAIENQCFTSDRLSRRSFRHFLTRGRSSLLVAEQQDAVIGYVLLLFHQGTSLARLYSIAVLREQRQSGVARVLVSQAEATAFDHGCITLRLEVRVDNQASIALFQNLGYRQFGRYLEYYEDSTDALRLEKRLSTKLPDSLHQVSYYRQTLDFTCGPAALMMAMHAHDATTPLDRTLELRLWRESTTIFMTSGHGGCSPFGLALAARRRGHSVAVFTTDGQPLFIDSVRSPEKKEVIRLVEADFLSEIERCNVEVRFNRLDTAGIFAALDAGSIPVVLISSWRIYNEKSPHWVVVTGYDSRFLYVHDPYIDEERGRTVTDCVNMPISVKEFSRMSRYGRSGQWAALILSKDSKPT